MQFRYNKKTFRIAKRNITYINQSNGKSIIDKDIDYLNQIINKLDVNNK